MKKNQENIELKKFILAIMGFITLFGLFITFSILTQGDGSLKFDWKSLYFIIPSIIIITEICWFKLFIPIQKYEDDNDFSTLIALKTMFILFASQIGLILHQIIKNIKLTTIVNIIKEIKLFLVTYYKTLLIFILVVILIIGFYYINIKIAQHKIGK